MRHRSGAIWTERLLLGLILFSLAGTLNLLVAIHRRASADRQSPPADAVSVAQVPAPSPAVDPVAQNPSPLENPALADKAQPEPPPPPAEDPTQKALAALAAATAKETEAADATDRRTSAIEAGYRSAVAESDRWKRREMLVRQQIAGITVDAQKLEREADELDAERDVLERERDATKAALAKASLRSGFAVLPYKGPNGTWRRPIVIECTRGGAKLQPRGPGFTTLELSPRIHPRSSVFVKAIARELLHIRATDTPDGAPAVPYIVFLVRPDGIAPYYLARTCLEPLGIAFGYELVEQKLEVNIPDFDDLTTWDGTVPLEMPLQPAPGIGTSSSRMAQANQPDDRQEPALAGTPRGDQGSMIGALDGAGRGNQPGGQGASSSGNPDPDAFVWPGRARQAARDGQQPSGASRGDDRGNLAMGGESAVPSRDHRAGGSQVAGGGSVLPSADRGAGGNSSDGSAGALRALTGPKLANSEDVGHGGNLAKNETAAAGDQIGAGRFSATASGGQGTGDQPVVSGSGVFPGAANTEDVGTGSGAGAGPADQPLSGNSGQPGTSGAAAGGTSPGGGNNPGAGSGGTDSILQIPNFEPAGDQAAGSASIGQPGLLSGRGSRGSTGAGPQAPTFGLGQTVKGSSTPGGDDASGGSGGMLSQPGGAGAAGAGGTGLIRPGSGGSLAAGGNSSSGAGQPTEGNPGSGGSGSDDGSSTKSTGGRPASDDSTGTKTTAMGGRGTGQGKGFDWDQAAKDTPNSSSAAASGSDPALGADPPDGDTGPQTSADAARANVAAGGALNRPNRPPTAQAGLQPGAYQSGQYSQDDIDRARSLSGLSSLVSPGLAEKLAGAASASGMPSGLSPSSTTSTDQSGGMPSSLSSSNTTSTDQSGGMPSSPASSNTSSNSQSGGMPLGGNTPSSVWSSPSSSYSFGQNTSPSSSSDEANDLIMPPRPKPVPPPGAIEARFQIVVVCRKDDVVLQPGSYRLTGDVLRSAGQGTDCLLAREIRAMVRNRAIVDPMIRQKPAIRFLVESQGAETFALARRQLLFSLPDWPVSLQVSGSQDAGVFSRNPW